MKYSSLLTICSLIAFTACGTSTVKDTLGISRKAPDEFRVVSRPALSVPPQFNLRPPSNSDESPTMIPTDKQAQSLVLGTTKNTDQTKNDANTFNLKQGNADTAVLPVDSTPLRSAKDTGSAGESQFLKNAGADKADPTVRDVLVEQRIEKEQQESSWWDVFSQPSEKKDALVNAKSEAKRINDNKTAGKPVTEGDTPEITDKDKGLLGRIFGW